MPKPQSIPLPPATPLSSRLTRIGMACGWSLCSWLTPVLLPMLLLLTILLGLLRLDQTARGDLSGRDRYRVSFASVTCASPPGLDREEFLDEVQYLASLPDNLSVIDDDLSSTLAAAFARHPWVEKVEAISLGPNRSVRVGLRFRTAALAVPYAGRLRVVDTHGILLPTSAPTRGLPVFNGIAQSPKGPAGTPWGDAAVTAVSRKVGP